MRITVRWAAWCGLGVALLLGGPMAALLWPRAAAEAQGDVLTPARSRLGINLAGPADWSTEQPFVDVFKLSREWISQREGTGWGQGPKLALDEHGWVKQLEPGCLADTPLCTIPDGHYPAGRYVCLYEGQGQIEFWNTVREVSREPGRIVVEVDPSKGGFWLRVRTVDPADYPRNIRVIMPGCEATYEEEEPFDPGFLKRWAEFSTIRFMDFMLTNGSGTTTWDDRPEPTDATYTTRGVPLEVMVDLCNRLEANPWFCIPHLAGDTYVRSFAEQVQRELAPGLKVYVEYSNEIWNYGFSQTKYAGNKGLELGLGEEHWEAGWAYSARRSVEIFAIFEEVFRGTDRLVRVIASQAANPYVSEQKLKFGNAYEHCDALAIAPYVSMNLSPAGDPSSDAVAGWTVDQVLDYLERKSLPEAVQWIQGSKAVADRYGVELIAYEAGQHAVGVGGGENNETLTRLLQAANRHERMGRIYTRYLDAWRDGGGGLMCMFSSVGAWSKWGSWGLIEYTDDDAPKYRAVLDWNRANPV